MPCCAEVPAAKPSCPSPSTSLVTDDSTTYRTRPCSHVSTAEAYAAAVVHDMSMDTAYHAKPCLSASCPARSKAAATFSQSPGGELPFGIGDCPELLSSYRASKAVRDGDLQAHDAGQAAELPCKFQVVLKQFEPSHMTFAEHGHSQDIY